MLTHVTHTTLGLFTSIGYGEVIVLALLGLLIFGKRLPEVGRSIGKGIVEFKKGLAGIEDDIDTATKQPPRIEKHSTSSTDTSASGEKTNAEHKA